MSRPTRFATSRVTLGRRVAALAGWIAALAVPIALAPATASAQQASLAVGFSSIPGDIGDVDSDHGFALRIGADFLAGRHLTWGLEGGIDRLNEVYRPYTSPCTFNGGGSVSCHGDTWHRDTGFSLGTILRIHPGPRRVRPYALIGVGYIGVNARERAVVVDDAGDPLDAFSFVRADREDALQGHLGGGVVFSTEGLPFDVMLEGRASRTYWLEGSSWTPSVTVGLRVGR